MSEYDDIAVTHDSEGDDDPLHTDAGHTSDTRSATNNKSSSGLNAKKGSKRGSRRGSMRSTSAVSFTAEDEAARERNHLIDSNKKLRAQVRTLKGQLRNLREARDGPISASEAKQIQLLKDQNADYEAEIEQLRAKAAVANDIETLDDLTDDVQEKEIQLKALELERRNLSDNGRTHAKLLNHNEAMPSRQKVFLDLKEERRHHKKRMRTLEATYERTKNYIKEVEKRADEQEAILRDRGILDVTMAHIKELRERDAEQKKQIETLRKQLAILNGTFDAQKTQTQWIAKDKEVEVERLREQCKELEQVILNKEKVIMSNFGWTDRPAHFLKPMGDEIPALPPSGTSGSNAAVEKPKKKDPVPKVKPQPPKTEPTSSRPQKAAGGGSAQQGASSDAASKPKPPASSAPAKKKPSGAASSSAPASGGAGAGSGASKKEPAALDAKTKKKLQDEEEAQLPSPRKPTPPEEQPPAHSNPRTSATTPPSQRTPSPVDSYNSKASNDRLNDIDSPKRSPTPPKRSPTPDYASDDFVEESPSRRNGKAAAAAAKDDDVVEDEVEQPSAAPSTSRHQAADDGGYGDDFEDDGGAKHGEEEPAFLTD